ncbi:MAG: sulfatase-like hydrolase/transferase [Planctomycetota bacterium]
MVEYTDKLVGRVIDRLHTLDLREDTLVIFTGDNGSTGGWPPGSTATGERKVLLHATPTKSLHRALPKGRRVHVLAFLDLAFQHAKGLAHGARRERRGSHAAFKGPGSGWGR